MPIGDMPEHAAIKSLEPVTDKPLRHLADTEVTTMAHPRRIAGPSLIPGAALLSACGNETQTDTDGFADSLMPSKQIDAAPPYIVHEECTFFLVTDVGTVSTPSARNSGPSGNATLNMGGHRVVLSECTLVENPDQLAVY